MIWHKIPHPLGLNSKARLLQSDGVKMSSLEPSCRERPKHLLFAVHIFFVVEYLSTEHRSRGCDILRHLLYTSACLLACATTARRKKMHFFFLPFHSVSMACRDVPTHRQELSIHIPTPLASRDSFFFFKRPDVCDPDGDVHRRQDSRHLPEGGNDCQGTCLLRVNHWQDWCGLMPCAAYHAPQADSCWFVRCATAVRRAADVVVV